MFFENRGVVVRIITIGKTTQVSGLKNKFKFISKKRLLLQKRVICLHPHLKNTNVQFIKRVFEVNFLT